MTDEIVPVQIRLWFADGGHYDLRGVLDSFQQDNDIEKHAEGIHTIARITEKHWTLTGRARPWEFDENGRPGLLATRPQLGAPKRLVVHTGPDRSPRARRRARANDRKRHAT